MLCALDAAGFHWVTIFSHNKIGKNYLISSFQASIEGAESGLDLSFVSSLKVLGLQLGVVKVPFKLSSSVAELTAVIIAVRVASQLYQLEKDS